MGKCRYCQQEAGFLRYKHAQCQQKFEQGKAEIVQILQNCFSTKTDFFLKKNDIQQIAQKSFIDTNTLNEIYCSALDKAVDSYLCDNIISPNEEQTIARFIQYCGLPQQQLNAHNALDKVVQSKIIEDLLAGRKPSPRIIISGPLPVLLTHNEILLWLFRNISLHEQKNRKEYIGRSQGMSFRIAKGVYYRTGRHKSIPVETSYMQRISTGSVCLTDRNLYYASPEKSLKIPYSKILSLEPYANGIGIQKDGTNSRPIFLENINSWFVYNVIANIK